MTNLFLPYSVVTLYILSIAVWYFSKDVENSNEFDATQLKHPEMFLASCILLCCNIVATISSAVYLIWR